MFALIILIEYILLMRTDIVPLALESDGLLACTEEDMEPDQIKTITDSIESLITVYLGIQIPVTLERAT